jgi:glyoxylase-like metal-dependent hydrolase (beta-lactamase superfamily II)
VKRLTNQPIKYVVNTHHHSDHSGSNAKMQTLGVQVVASEQARANMVDGKQPGLPTMVFEHHAHVYLGGKNVELYHFGRAHTDGDVVVLFPAQRTLAAGDMFTFDARADRLLGRRQREGMDPHARLGAPARLRQRRTRPRQCHDQSRDAEIP